MKKGILILAMGIVSVLGYSSDVNVHKNHETVVVNKIDKLERNKKNVVEFYNLAFNKGKFKEAADKYIGDVYIQHNPGVADGANAFIEVMSALKNQFPKMKTEIKRVIAEGDLVVIHVFSQIDPNIKGSAVIDIFRLDENGKIVEHWDIIQEIPEKSANNNTMF